eukprot:256990_1
MDDMACTVVDTILEFAPAENKVFLETSKAHQIADKSKNKTNVTYTSTLYNNSTAVKRFIASKCNCVFLLSLMLTIWDYISDILLSLELVENPIECENDVCLDSWIEYPQVVNMTNCGIALLVFSTLGFAVGIFCQCANGSKISKHFHTDEEDLNMSLIPIPVLCIEDTPSLIIALAIGYQITSSGWQLTIAWHLSFWTSFFSVCVQITKLHYHQKFCVEQSCYTEDQTFRCVFYLCCYLLTFGISGAVLVGNQMALNNNNIGWGYARVSFVEEHHLHNESKYVNSSAFDDCFFRLEYECQEAVIAEACYWKLNDLERIFIAGFYNSSHFEYNTECKAVIYHNDHAHHIKWNEYVLIGMGLGEEIDHINISISRSEQLYVLIYTQQCVCKMGGSLWTW